MKTIKINSDSEVPKNFTGIVEYSDGTKIWYKEGIFHREDGPAKEYSNGTKVWFKEGNYHREDGPAIEYYDRTKEWWVDGKKYSRERFETLTNTSIFLEIKRGRFNLEWIKFLTDQGIKEYPIIPGMNLNLTSF